MTISKRLKELNHGKIIAVMLLAALAINTFAISVEFARTGHVEGVVMMWQVFIIAGVLWLAYKL